MNEIGAKSKTSLVPQTEGKMVLNTDLFARQTELYQRQESHAVLHHPKSYLIGFFLCFLFQNKEQQQQAVPFGDKH